MCSTAYEIILSFPEDELKHLRCDLKKRIIFSRGKQIFSEEAFHDCGGANILNSVPLIQNTKLTEEQWFEDLQHLYAAFKACYPVTMQSYVNFYPVKIKDMTTISRLDFHHCRLALELYILFHSCQKNFEWEIASHFMRVIAPDCVVYRSWFLKEDSYVPFRVDDGVTRSHW